MNEKLDPNANIQMPSTWVPNFRTAVAIQSEVEKNILMKTWGGIGDQICAEPTLRYALKVFKCDVSLASELPELFSHLKFKEIIDLNKYRPIYEKYLSFETIAAPDADLTWQFMSHLLVNCVDFASLCALRMQLPTSERNVTLPDCGYKVPFELENTVVVHPGKHWATKTFPKDWWDHVLIILRQTGVTPILIGANADDNRGTVDVDNEGCIDLRNQLSLLETISLLKQSKVLLTNDSAPLHMAVDSACWIGYIATCKHPDMITHWRKPLEPRNGEGLYEFPNSWSWRMENLGLSGIWDIVDMTPNTDKKIEVEFVEESILRSWLPEPVAYAKWAAQKVFGS